MVVKDAMIEEYFSLKPTRFSNLVHFGFSQSAPGNTKREPNSLEVVLSGLETPATLCLSFLGVRELKVEDPLDGCTGIFLDIGMKEVDQWEGVRYRVTDEHGVLTFYCAEFSAKII